VIDSEPLLNVNVFRNFGLKIPGCYGDFRRLSHTVLCCIVSSVRISDFLSKVFDADDLTVPTFGN